MKIKWASVITRGAPTTIRPFNHRVSSYERIPTHHALLPPHTHPPRPLQTNHRHTLLTLRPHPRHRIRRRNRPSLGRIHPASLPPSVVEGTHKGDQRYRVEQGWDVPRYGFRRRNSHHLVHTDGQTTPHAPWTYIPRLVSRIQPQIKHPRDGRVG